MWPYTTVDSLDSGREREKKGGKEDRWERQKDRQREREVDTAVVRSL